MLDPTAQDIWLEYASYFNNKWRLKYDDIVDIGRTGDVVFSAEFSEHGVNAYRTSIVQPIRNAYYNSHRIVRRSANFDHFEIVEPVLDYGCGCGFVLRWLQLEHGLTELYGTDVEGVQSSVFREFFADKGVKWWARDDKPTKFGTIICLNVLEHIDNPTEVLTYLRSMCSNLIANCDESDEKDEHIVSMEERRNINISLRAASEHFEGPYADMC